MTIFVSHSFSCLDDLNKGGLEAILAIFGRRALIFCLKTLGKNEN